MLCNENYMAKFDVYEYSIPRWIRSHFRHDVFYIIIIIYCNVKYQEIRIRWSLGLLLVAVERKLSFFVRMLFRRRRKTGP